MFRSPLSDAVDSTGDRRKARIVADRHRIVCSAQPPEHHYGLQYDQCATGGNGHAIRNSQYTRPLPAKANDRFSRGLPRADLLQRPACND
jgi:hypothetical protein